MNIVMIGPFGLKLKSTMRERALPMARALRRRGHKVTVIVPPWDSPEDAGKSWRDEGVLVINTALPRLKGPLFHLQLTGDLVKLALQFQPEVIHLFKPKAYAGLAHVLLRSLKQLRRHNIKLAVDEDDWEVAWNEVHDYTAAQKRFFAWQEPWGLARADVVTVASKQLRYLVEKYRVPPRSIFYIPNGVRPIDSPLKVLKAHALWQEELLRVAAGVTDAAAKIPFPSKAFLDLDLRYKEFGNRIREQYDLFDRPIILLYTRFAEFELKTLLEVIYKVSRYMPAARWLIVGKGYFAEEKKLAQMARRRGVANKLIFVGWVPQRELPYYFEAANVALHLYQDTIINRTKCSVKLLDLMSAGVPVVATNVGQNAEYIVHRDTGLLVPPGDVNAIANTLVTVLNVQALQYVLGRAAARHVNRVFKWDNLVKLVEQAYTNDK